MARIRTLSAEIDVPEHALRALGCEIVLPGTADYDERRRVWNRMIDRRPGAIVRPRTSSEVQAAVRLAGEHDLLVSIRGGGHNVTGNAVTDGGLMIDLSAMRATRVDLASRNAQAGPGQTWGELDAALQAHGRVTVGGIVSTTGIAGLTLGGGHGWLTRTHGLTCDNLVGAEIVTADGALRYASPDDNADLFWALRGGGGNFGVVTRFDYRIHPLDGVYAGARVYPFARAREVLEHYFECTERAPETLALYAIVSTWPDGTPVISLVACSSAPTAQAERDLAPLRRLDGALADTIAPVSYATLQTSTDPNNPPDVWYYKTGYVRDRQPGSRAFIDTLIANCDFPSPSPRSRIVIEQLGGAMSRVPKEATAFSHRDAQFTLIFIAGGFAPATTDANRDWARRACAAMQPFMSGGAYVNYLDADDGERGMRAAYGESHARLAAVKQRYDPGNRFRLNVNVRPG